MELYTYGTIINYHELSWTRMHYYTIFIHLKHLGTSISISARAVSGAVSGAASGDQGFNSSSMRRCLGVASTVFIAGSLEVKLPTIWTDGEAKVGRVRDEKESEEKKSEEKKSEERRSKFARKLPKTVFSNGLWLWGSKNRLAKAGATEPSGRLRNQNCTPLWREARSKSTC